MISVSVAMATYNGEKHIRRQLQSLAGQRHVPTELVVTDDGSTDRTIAIVEEFAKTAPFPVSIYRNATRLGYRANFMRAANLCKSELIAFCDQDDYWYPHKLAEAIKPFGDPEVLLTYHNADVVTGNGKRIGSLAKHAAHTPILTSMSSGPWRYAQGFTEVFRRSLLSLSSLWPSSLDLLDRYDGSQPLPHDQWVFFLAAVFGRIAYVNEPLVAYVQHGSNVYGWTKPSFPPLKSLFRDRSDEISRFAKAAENRAALLELTRDNLCNVWKERAVAASQRYRKLAWLYAERNTLYKSADIRDRLKVFRAILLNGGYVQRWNLGHKSLLTDACLGVLFAPFLRCGID